MNPNINLFISKAIFQVISNTGSTAHTSNIQRNNNTGSTAHTSNIQRNNNNTGSTAHTSNIQPNNNTGSTAHTSNIQSNKNTGSTAHTNRCAIHKTCCFAQLTCYSFTALPTLPSKCLTDSHQHSAKPKTNKHWACKPSL